MQKKVTLPFIIASVLACTGAKATYAEPTAPRTWLLPIAVKNNVRLRDDQRGTNLRVRMVFPTAKGNYPVIIFSHGAGGSKDNYTSLTDFWAEHGFICIQPTHQDSVQNLREKNRTATIFTAIHKTDDQRYWISRIQDMETAIDQLNDIQTFLPKGVVLEADKLGVAGHSFGAFTAQLLAGAVPYIETGILPGKSGNLSFVDPRVKAFILLSPQGVIKKGLGLPTPGAWNQMNAPFLLMTGSEDRGHHGQPAQWRTQPYLYAPKGDKYLFFLQGANHMTFAGQDNFRPLRVKAKVQAKNLFHYVQDATLDFWQAYLKDDQAAKEALLEHKAAKESGGLVLQDNK